MLWAGAAARTGLYKFPEGLRKQGGSWRIYLRCYRHLYEVALSLPLPIRADAGRGGADSMKSGEKSTLSRAPRSSEWIREDNEGAARRVWPYRKHWKRDPGVPGLGCTVLWADDAKRTPRPSKQGMNEHRLGNNSPRKRSGDLKLWDHGSICIRKSL